MAKIYFFIFHASTMITFGAKLLIKPEKFFHKTDLLEDKEYIENAFAMTKRLLSSKPIDRFTHNDTVEFVRVRNKKFAPYIIKYSSPDNGGFVQNVPIKCKELKQSFSLRSVFQNITTIVGMKRGIFRRLPLFATWEQIRNATFEMTEKESEVFNKLGL